jgi:hypothetical protein
MITRSFFAFVFLTSALWGAPPLTTIQDTLYKADGARFNGTLTIRWNSFDGPGETAIVQQSTSVKVLDGFFRVQLVPTTSSQNGATYQVTYNSDGLEQFMETWSVPSSGQPLRVRDVRVATASSSTGSGVSPETTGPVQEADVVGLVSDLMARPSKGPGFAAGRVAMVNDTGLLESVTGTATDCVRVDGSSGPCGPVPGFIDADNLSGVADGSNADFSLSSQPSPVTSLAVYRNGLLQKIGQDFTLSGNTVHFLSGAVPMAGDTLLASYRMPDGSQTETPAVYSTSQVICSGIGATTSALTATSIGTCMLPAAALSAGDRLEIHFDLAHQGAAGAFVFDVMWGATTLLSRTASASDTLVAGRIGVSVLASGVQVSAQSWGTVLPLNAGIGVAADDVSAGILLRFRASLGSSSDAVALRNFSVVRLP